jgi:L-ascorbate metabolism protein UlaG (beta-lactamase superfamily)
MIRTDALPHHGLLLLLLAAAFTLTSCGAARPTATSEPALPEQLEITYIDNDCFLLAYRGQKILTDPHARIYPKTIRESMQSAAPPFGGLDLILVTHNHSDHFDADLVGTTLVASPGAILATTQATADDLQARFTGFDRLKDRVQVFSPKEGERLQATLNGIDLEIVSLSHGGTPENLGFMMHIGGKKVLHSGDTYPRYIATYDFPKDNLDVALVPYDFFLERDSDWAGGLQAALEGIRARWFIPMHYAPTTPDKEVILQRVADVCPNSILFHAAMETRVVQ